MKIKYTLTLILFTVISYCNSYAQSLNYGDISYNKAVNISGKQRMLSQKMSKAYLLMAKGVKDEKIKRELNSSKFIFKKQLEILKANASSSSTKLYIKSIYKLWNKFNVLLSDTPPNISTSKQIIDLNTALLKACNNLVVDIEAKSNYDNKFFENNNQELVKIINVSGKQRMLSQRLCLYYIASVMFPKDKATYRTMLSKVFDEFDSVIGYLLINGYNTTESEEELGAIMAIWEKFQANKSDFLDGKYNLVEVYSTTNALTTSFNKVTGIYEIVAKNY